MPNLERPRSALFTTRPPYLRIQVHQITNMLVTYAHNEESMVGKLAITGPHFTTHMSEIAFHLDVFRYDERARTLIWRSFANDYDRDNGDASSITDGFHACESMGWLLHDMREHMNMLHDPNNYSLGARPGGPPIG